MVIIQEDITDIVGSLVASMDNKIKGTYDVGLGKTLSCDTKWLRKGKRVIGTETYVIDSIVYNTSMTSTQITNTTIPVDLEGTIKIPLPFYVNGTRNAANSEWTRVSSKLIEKTPLIWLNESTIEEEIQGDNTPVERESHLQIFFLDETNPTLYETDDHRHEVVLPMQRLVDEFIKVINSTKKFKKLRNFTIKTFTRFGVEDETGVFENILDANLSGVELRLTLVKYKQNCSCN